MKTKHDCPICEVHVRNAAKDDDYIGKLQEEVDHLKSRLESTQQIVIHLKEKLGLTSLADVTQEMGEKNNE